MEGRASVHLEDLHHPISDPAPRDEEATVMGFLLQLVTGNDEIASQIRDEGDSISEQRERVRSLAYWWAI